jgi:antirestriction protein ArdC/phage/plasmid primase-like uncharacterized protein
MTSNSAYHGFNQITLIMASLQKGYQDPRWLTFEQAKSYGAMIKPNEKAVRLSYYKKITEDTPTYDENGNISESQKKDAIKRIPFCIFNAEQVIGLPEYQHDTDSIKVSHRVDELIKNSGIQIVNSDRKSLSYNLKDDVLKIPHRQSFKGQTHYQETMIHGMAHWSGHASRLNRTMTAAFGTEEYALEKLRTDISAFLISGELGLGYTPRANSAYVDTWIQKLTNEPAYFHKITGDVKKIEGFIMKYDNETLKEQFKNYSVLNDPNIIPLKVPFEEKDEAKALGARYQRNAKCWFIQKTDNQDVFKKWLPKDHSKNVDKQNIEMSDRLYLYVPYSEREDAKTTGAKWDGKFKSWYCNKSEKKQFSKWVFEIEKPKAFNTQSFDDVLFKNGFTFLPGQTLQDDGNWHQLHRISNGKRNASYMTWDAKDNHKNIAGAVIKDFVSSEKTYWFEAEANSEKSIPKEQKHMRMVNALQRDQVQKNEAREHLKEMISSCTKEHHSLDNLFDSFPNHKYFHELKKIKPTKGIKYKKTHEIKKKDGSTFTLKNVATVPLFNIDNEITGFQRIDEKGNKYYDSNIIKKESFHPCGDYIKGQPICLAEGIATAISIHELSGLQVHSTLDCHNLEDVAKKLNEKYPERPILFFADDDHAAESENVGQVHAYNAAKKLKQPTHHVISPPLTQEDIKNGYTDFNDVHQSRAEEISVFINQNLKEHLDITLDIEEDINDENPSPTKPKKEHDSKKGYSPEPQRLAMSTSKDLDDDAGY